VSALVPLATILGLLLISAAAWFFALTLTRRNRLVLEGRMNLVSGAALSASPDAGAIAAARKSTSVAGAWIRRAFSVGAARRWGMEAGGIKLVVIAMAAALATWLFLRIAMHLSNGIAIPAACGGFFLAPRILLSRQQRRTEQRFMVLFPDAVDMAVRIMRAGLPITAATRAIANEAPAPVNKVFRVLADKVDIGIPFESALVTAGETIGLPDFRFFAVAISLQRATGGNLTATLDMLAEMVRKRRTVRLQAQAATGEVRMSAIILGALPFFVTGTFMVISPGYLAPLINDPRGNAIIGLALLGLLLAYLTMRRMLHSVTMA
jgi:tight adherence protein B